MTYLISISSLLFITSIFFIFKYLRLRKNVKSYQRIGTGRHGYYKFGNDYKNKSYVHIKEIDRYENDMSKIIIDKIEPLDLNYVNDSILFAKRYFISVVRTDNIIWLESENHLKQVRKEKLEALKKL